MNASDISARIEWQAAKEAEREQWQCNWWERYNSAERERLAREKAAHQDIFQVQLASAR